MTFDGVCLITEDVGALTRFYAQVLQAEAVGDDTHAEVKTPGAGLAIYARSAAQRDMGFTFDGRCGTGMATFSFSVADVDVEYRRLLSVGVSFVTEPTTYPWGWRAMHFRDPDGNLVGFRTRVGEGRTDASPDAQSEAIETAGDSAAVHAANRTAEVEGILDFMVELERLKSVTRKSRPVGTGRYENSAEHSWHVCLSALVLREHANDAIDMDRVIRMLLIHDLGEIDAGDTIVYARQTPADRAREAAGVQRVLSHLPAHTQRACMELWHEFESGQTADARYARAIDRVPPLLQNLHDNGHAWQAHGITREQVFALNARIGQGSTALWNAVQARLADGVERGILK